MNTQGIGLGLVISENIVKSFSGEIGVKSIYNKGTQFTFSFLLGKSDLQEDQVVVENNKKTVQRGQLYSSNTYSSIKPNSTSNEQVSEKLQAK